MARAAVHDARAAHPAADGNSGSDNGGDNAGDSGGQVEGQPSSTQEAQEDQGPGIGSDLLYGPIGAGVGNMAYAMTFYDVAYTFEYAPWAGATNSSPVLLSGVSYTENRGALGNLIVSIILQIAAASSRRTSVELGRDSNYIYYRSLTVYEQQAENARVAQAVAAAARIAEQRPLSFSFRAYHEVLGSQMDGAAFEMTYAGVIRVLSGIVIQGGFGAGSLRNNHLAPTTSSGQTGRDWLGPTLVVRMPFFRYLGTRLGAMYSFLSPNFLLLDTGLEGRIGNRIELRALATLDVLRGLAGDSFGLRAELGVRF